MAGDQAERPPRRAEVRLVSGVRVTVLSGLDRLAADDLATSLLLRHERLAVLYGDPTTGEQGYVTMRLRSSTGRALSWTLPLEHECLSCTMRTAMLAALSNLTASGEYDQVVLHLHPGIEPDVAIRCLLAALPAGARIDSHVTVLAEGWLDVLSGGRSLAEFGAGVSDGDDRFAAAVLAAGIESATTVVRTVVVADDAREERAVLALLAPGAVQLRLHTALDVPDADVLGTNRLVADDLDPLRPYGIRDPHRSFGRVGTLRLVRWEAARPLHPLRLQAAVDVLADGVIRSSGRLDVADQPDSVVGWDSAGDSLTIGPIAPCADPPVLRRSSLAFLGSDLDAQHIRTTLDRCLLTDDELALVTADYNDLSDLDAGRFLSPSPETAAGQGGTAA